MAINILSAKYYMDYFSKYKKYKHKYLQLKQAGGGSDSKPLLNSWKMILLTADNAIKSIRFINLNLEFSQHFIVYDILNNDKEQELLEQQRLYTLLHTELNGDWKNIKFLKALDFNDLFRWLSVVKIEGADIVINLNEFNCTIMFNESGNRLPIPFITPENNTIYDQSIKNIIQSVNPPAGYVRDVVNFFKIVPTPPILHDDRRQLILYGIIKFLDFKKDIYNAISSS